MIRGMLRDFEIRLRLHEIAKKSAELSTRTQMLNDMVAQLDRLRALTVRAGSSGVRGQSREANDLH